MYINLLYISFISLLPLNWWLGYKMKLSEQQYPLSSFIMKCKAVTTFGSHVFSVFPVAFRSY